MTERVWDKFLTERDRAVFSAAGFGGRMGFPRRPAVLIVDVNYAFVGDKPEPILESIKRWPLSCGEEGWAALPIIKQIANAAREKGLPVIYTTGVRRADGWDNGSWSWKNARQNDASYKPLNIDGQAIVAEVSPRPSDIVIYKQKPSAFYATPLMSYLQLLRCDGIILMGTTTSGCVRATAIDAFSNNLRTTIVEEACFDRSEASHAISLCDLHAKYADVVDSAEVMKYVTTLDHDGFDLPSAK